MIVFHLLLVAFSAAQETHIDSNDITDVKPDMSFELEDLDDYSNGPNYPWLEYLIKLSQSNYNNDDSSSSSEEMSFKHARSDPEANAEKNLDFANDYDDNILEAPTSRMVSLLELFGHFLNGKKKLLNGINEGVLGGKTFLDGIQEITKGLGDLLATT
ncbi:PREDICTED: uncharacterized protein LOC106120580 [Papilio xuthus]|uniref:Uncharacterized protein LOC106120580 n=1 Tax=Papilio xuthus TaxID=66420 RepID=A0AAJ6ZF89_PAPXU|nr:PREDICTED: uncharacterized protein LOC106120580 [Papilio xuthus]